MKPGEAYFSDLVDEDGQIVRRDFGVASWEGPSEDSLGWWRSRVPAQEEKQKLAPNEVLLNLFVGLEQRPAESKFRYVLSLLLVRRKVLKPEETSRDEQGQEIIILTSSARNEQYEVLADEPNEAEAESIQQKMIELLYGENDNAPKTSTPQAA